MQSLPIGKVGCSQTVVGASTLWDYAYRKVLSRLASLAKCGGTRSGRAAAHWEGALSWPRYLFEKKKKVVIGFSLLNATTVTAPQYRSIFHTCGRVLGCWLSRPAQTPPCCAMHTVPFAPLLLFLSRLATSLASVQLKRSPSPYSSWNTRPP